MSSRARFIEEIDSLRDAVELPVLVENSIDAKVRQKLIAGVAITTFISVEQFVSTRMAELSAFISTGVSKFTDLTEDARRLLLVRTSRNLLADMWRAESTESERVAGARAVGGMLKEVGVANLTMAGASLSWSGSNLQVADLEEIFAILGCREKTWSHLTAVLKRSGSDLGATHARALFTLLSSTRHDAAHSAARPISVVELRALPRSALLLGYSVDTLASHLALELQRGRTAGLTKNVHEIVRLRWVEAVRPKWRHVAEGRVQGKRFATRDEAWVGATQAAGIAEETVVERDSDGDPVRWQPAFCP